MAKKRLCCKNWPKPDYPVHAVNKKRKNTSMHPWHDVPVGEKAPQIVNAVIEIPQGSHVKYEIDKTTGMIKVDRILSSCVYYPLNYGFIPKTLCDDKDALDVLVFGQYPVVPLSLMEVKVIGAMKMIDQGELDDKILAVHTSDPLYKNISSFSQIPPHTLEQLKRFFSDYKLLEKKKVEVGDFMDAQAAFGIIQESIALYSKTHT
jgi:inorganic pyrophosphatase